MTLITKPNLKNPDDFYADLLLVHEGLSDEQSMDLNSRLILILANHVGDNNVLSDALNAASKAANSKV